MPKYEYACKSCGEHIEVLQTFADDPLTECPACGGPLRKVFSPPSIAFKGSGFYRTDNRKRRTEPTADTKNEKATADSKSSATSSDSDSGSSKSESTKAEPAKAESAAKTSGSESKSSESKSSDSKSSDAKSSTESKPKAAEAKTGS